MLFPPIWNFRWREQVGITLRSSGQEASATFESAGVIGAGWLLGDRLRSFDCVSANGAVTPLRMIVGVKGLSDCHDPSTARPGAPNGGAKKMPGRFAQDDNVFGVVAWLTK